VALRRTERGYETEEEIAYRRKMGVFGLVLALACALLPLFLIMRRFRR